MRKSRSRTCTKALMAMLVMLLMMYPAANAEGTQTIAYAVSGGNIYFDPATGTITGCDNTVTTVVIPASIQGVRVEAIGDVAFDSKANLTKVVLPEGITTIGFRAFGYNSKLTSVNLPGSITSISSGAFNMTTSLRSVGPTGGGYDIEYGWKEEIPEHAFDCATGVSSVVIADGITTLGKSCFEATAIAELRLPDSVTTIKDYAFESCSSLRTLQFSNNLTSIGERAFEGCTKLPSLYLPYGLKTIGHRCFGKCSLLTSVYIPASVTSIGSMAFWRCTALERFYVDGQSSYFTAIDGVLFSEGGRCLHSYPTGRTGSYTVPNGITKIGYGAFEDCTNITEIKIPYGLTYIDVWAFYGCTGLKTVTLPGSVTNIGNNGFRSCSALEKLHYNGTPEQWSSTSFGFYNEPIQQVAIEYHYYTINVTARANGTATASATSAAEGQTVTLVATPNRGYRFRQWHVNSGNIAVTNDKFTMGNANVNIEAEFEQDSHRVIFDPNGGSVSPSNKTVVNGELFGDLPVPYFEGNSFQGWYTSVTGGSQITSSTTVNLFGDQTLYAHWAYASLSCTFNPNGGTVSPTSKTVFYGSAYGDLPTPIRTGYTFDGWYTASSGGTRITETTTVAFSYAHTLYAHWKQHYTVTYNANGGTGTPSSQIKEENVPLTLSSLIPSKTHLISYNANGGSVSPASKSISCTFNNWNGNGNTYRPSGQYTANASVTLYAQWIDPAAGTLATPQRSGYTFAGWYTSATGGTRVDDTYTVTGNMTVYAHWNTVGYTMGVHTYSFSNFGDSDSPGGHCFGMSITSSGYYIGALNISRIGGNANTPLYSFSRTAVVKAPICYYQAIQGSYASRSTVAGGSYYLNGYFAIEQDWQQVVNYVRDHSYDNKGSLQIGFRKKNEGGHAINFLRYENVNGQDRIYAYDNNFPTQETYFYRDASGNVRQTPVQTFSGTIDCIALRDCRTYFDIVGGFDSSHALYMAKDAAVVQGYSYTYIDTGFSDEEYVMYEIPAGQDRVIIIPNRDNADFIYMDTEYSFGEITDDTYGELRLATLYEGNVVTSANFRILNGDTELGEPDLTLPAALTRIDVSAFEGIAATTVYVPDTCVSIGAYAFRNSAVRKIRIPAGCTMASTAFDGCEDVRIFGTIGSPAEAFCKAHDNCSFIPE